MGRKQIFFYAIAFALISALVAVPRLADTISGGRAGGWDLAFTLLGLLAGLGAVVWIIVYRPSTWDRD
jgi:hypothetical protein